jgi:hypothetical protein
MFCITLPEIRFAIPNLLARALPGPLLPALILSLLLVAMLGVRVDFGFVCTVGAEGVIAIALPPCVDHVQLLRQTDLLPRLPAGVTNIARPVALGR